MNPSNILDLIVQATLKELKKAILASSGNAKFNQEERIEAACKQYILDWITKPRPDDAPSGGIYGLPTNDQSQKLLVGEVFGIKQIPPGFLPCDGREVFISDYPELFAVIGTAYGTPQNCASFKLPDWRSGCGPNPRTSWAIKAKEVQA